MTDTIKVNDIEYISLDKGKYREIELLRKKK